jgi:hypothetical protein
VGVGDIEEVALFFTDTIVGGRGAKEEDIRASALCVRSMINIPHINPAIRKRYKSFRIASSNASTDNYSTTVQAHPAGTELAHLGYASSCLYKDVRGGVYLTLATITIITRCRIMAMKKPAPMKTIHLRS